LPTVTGRSPGRNHRSNYRAVPGRGFGIEHLENTAYLLSEPFSFSYGSEDGKSNVTALRFSQEFIQRSQAQVLALTSRFSFGIEAWNATIHNDSNIPDSRYIA
jgi:hypothetical protein